MAQATAMEIEQNFFVERYAELVKFVALIDIIMKKAGIVEETDSFNLDTSDEIAGIVSTVFTGLRKSAKTKKIDDKFLKYQAPIGGALIGLEDIFSEFATAEHEFDFKVATPIMNLITGFKLFFDEVSQVNWCDQI